MSAWLKHQYGLTEEDYQSILENQGGVCWICERPERIKNRRLSVDHDHTDGKIRGLLCHFCNHHFVSNHRNPVLFERAAAYLRQDTGFIVPENKIKTRSRRRKRKAKK
jgi:hypothetical protein